MIVLGLGLLCSRCRQSPLTVNSSSKGSHQQTDGQTDRNIAFENTECIIKGGMFKVCFLKIKLKCFASFAMYLNEVISGNRCLLHSTYK